MFNAFLKKRPQINQKDLETAFKLKYNKFKELLTCNNDILEIMADMEAKSKGYELFTMAYIRSKITSIGIKTYKGIKNLNKIGGDRYQELYKRLETINVAIDRVLSKEPEIQFKEYILPFEKITLDVTDAVGEKSANLGEIRNRLGIFVPEGFAITSYAYKKFVDYKDLKEEIARQLVMLNTDNLEQLYKISSRIQQLIISAPLPPDLEEAILNAYEELEKEPRPGVKVALRSSALGEDRATSSFAGQYKTVLNIGKEEICDTYKEIVASKYSPQAILYIRTKGFRIRDIFMCVGCLAMVDSWISGVAYSYNPSEMERDEIVINSVYGLGRFAVEGAVSPDLYMVSKDKKRDIIKKVISEKDKMLVCHPIEGTEVVPLPEELKTQPCLSDQEIKELAEYVLRLESHYGKPLDIEWAIDKKRKIYILQTRPLQSLRKIAFKKPKIQGHRVLIKKGTIICAGAASGPAFHVRATVDLLRFPKGAVIVADVPLPQYASLLKNAVAIVTNVGSVTGHLASVSREFGIPAIFDTKIATKVIPHGLKITVDAYNGRVYEGRIKKLMEIKGEQRPIMINTPVFHTLKEVINFISPLNLIDPASSDFTPKNCKSIHDITRFAHEMVINEMFAISDRKFRDIGGAKKLISEIPMNLYVIDLGESLKKEVKNRSKITIEDIISKPMLALWRGMSYPGVTWTGPVNVDARGFFGIIMRSASGAHQGIRKLGENSYFIISKDYLNLNSKLAYHFATVDAYCSEYPENNYITFRFHGGAASLDRRVRRIRFISEVLKRLGFHVVQRGDYVNARIQRYNQEVIEEKLDYLGRLMGCSRQADVIMANDDIINMYINAFMEGNYCFEFAKEELVGNKRGSL